MHWAAYPFLRISLLFCLGIFFFEYADLPDFISYSGFTCFIVIYFLTHLFLNSALLKPVLLGIILMLISFFSGGIVLSFKANDMNKVPEAFQVNTELIFSGIITEQPASKSRLRTFIRLLHFGLHPDSLHPVNLKVIAYFSLNDSIAANYREGDLVQFKSKIKPVTQGTNPEAFDYTSYLKYRSVSWQVSVPEAKHHLHSSGHLHWFKKLANDSRTVCLNTLKKYITDDRKLAVSQAILLGYRNLISDDLYQDFTDTGAIHVLAVSGLHVAIVISFFVFFFNKISLKNAFYKWFKLAILLFIVWFYVLMTGASPAVMRAGLMVTLFLVGKFRVNNTSIYNILALAAICLLIMDPFLLFQASFQFSFLALISIVYFQPFISNWWNPSSKILNYAWNLISVAIAAQIMVFPITIYYFHKFPVYFMITGLIAVPMVFGILYLGLILLVFEQILPIVNIVLGPVFNALLDVFLYVIVSIRQLPYSSIKEVWLDQTGLFLMYVMIIAFMIFLTTRYLFWFRTFLLVAFCSIVNLLWSEHHTKNQSKLFVYDVFGGYLIDIFEGQTCYSFKSDNLETKAESFAASNNRLLHKIKKVYNIQDSFFMKRNGFEKYKNLIRINDQIHYLYNPIDAKRLNNEMPEFKTIFISSEVATKLPENIAAFKTEIFILDRNIKPWHKNKWVAALEQYNFKFHDVYLHGAFISNLNVK